MKKLIFISLVILFLSGCAISNSKKSEPSAKLDNKFIFEYTCLFANNPLIITIDFKKYKIKFAGDLFNTQGESDSSILGVSEDLTYFSHFMINEKKIYLFEVADVKKTRLNNKVTMNLRILHSTKDKISEPEVITGICSHEWK